MERFLEIKYYLFKFSNNILFCKFYVFKNFVSSFATYTFRYVSEKKITVKLFMMKFWRNKSNTF